MCVLAEWYKPLGVSVFRGISWCFVVLIYDLYSVMNWFWVWFHLGLIRLRFWGIMLCWWVMVELIFIRFWFTYSCWFGIVSFCVGYILSDKITIMYCCWFHRDAVYFRVFRYSECISLIWKEPHYNKLQVSQASRRLFQCSRKILYRFQLR